MAVFKWIDGVNIENNDTKVIEYSLLCETYKVSQMGFNIPTINYSNAQAESFFSKYESLKMNQNSLDDEMIMKLLTEKMSQIRHRANRLLSFSDYCNKSNQKLYITHGDAGGNFMQSSQDNYIIDWDEVMYAPIERDAWVMCNYEWARETFNSELFEVDIVIYSIITT